MIAVGDQVAEAVGAIPLGRSVGEPLNREDDWIAGPLDRVQLNRRTHAAWEPAEGLCRRDHGVGLAPIVQQPGGCSDLRPQQRACQQGEDDPAHPGPPRKAGDRVGASGSDQDDQRIDRQYIAHKMDRLRHEQQQFHSHHSEQQRKLARIVSHQGW